VFLLWQIITSRGILIIADEIRHMFKKISQRFENCQFSKLGSAIMTLMPIDVFIELISLLVFLFFFILRLPLELPALFLPAYSTHFGTVWFVFFYS